MKLHTLGFTREFGARVEVLSREVVSYQTEVDVRFVIGKQQ
jgi:hypothetical protein